MVPGTSFTNFSWTKFHQHLCVHNYIFPVGLPPQENTPASLAPNSIFPKGLPSVLWVVGVFSLGVQNQQENC